MSFAPLTLLLRKKKHILNCIFFLFYINNGAKRCGICWKHDFPYFQHRIYKSCVGNKENHVFSIYRSVLLRCWYKTGKICSSIYAFFSWVIASTEQNSLFYFLKPGFDRKSEKDKIMSTLGIYNWRATLFYEVIAATKQNSGCYYFFSTYYECQYGK